jgi:O-antigen ligase
VLLFGVPLALVGVAALRRSTLGPLPLIAGFAVLVALALVLPRAASSDIRWALLPPAAALGGYLTARFPTAALTIVFTLTGTYGSIRAFTGIPADSVADKVIDGLWVGVLGGLILGRRRLALRPTPALVLLTGFLAVTFIEALATDPLSSGIRAFRLGPEFLSLVLLIGAGGFSDRTLERFARAVVVVSLGVAAYATLRWAIGTSAKEQALQNSAFAQQYDQLAYTGDVKLQGSLPNGNSLGLWLACTMPFLMAVAVSWRGRYRWLAIAALPLATIALLGSSRRAALAGIVAAGATILIVHVLSRGFRGPRLGVAVGAVLIVFIGASVIYPAVADNGEKRKRYDELLHPGEDASFQARLQKWHETLDAMHGQPFGAGLGAGNPLAITHRFVDVAYSEIDNSYLMVGYEQGPIAMGLFVVTLLVLLVELLRHAVWTRGPGPAALSTAAAGTLVATLVELFSADYYYAPPIVAGWMVVGLGVASFARRRSAPGGAVDVAV